MKVYVIMHDETKQACPVEANSPDEAREKVGKILGCDVSHCPVYEVDKDSDLEAIISIVAQEASRSKS